MSQSWADGPPAEGLGVCTLAEGGDPVITMCTGKTKRGITGEKHNASPHLLEHVTSFLFMFMQGQTLRKSSLYNLVTILAS